MAWFPSGLPVTRKVRAHGIRLRGVLFVSPNFAELDGQTVEIVDQGLAEDSVPVFGPTGSFTAVVAMLATNEDRAEYRRRQAAWRQARALFRSVGRLRVERAGREHVDWMTHILGAGRSRAASRVRR